jgi:hypothetical protein
MRNAHVASQLQHVRISEYIAGEAGFLAQVEAAVFAGYDSGGILSPVLQHREGVEQLLVDVLMGNYCSDTTHVDKSKPYKKLRVMKKVRESGRKAGFQPNGRILKMRKQFRFMPPGVPGQRREAGKNHDQIDK